MSTSSFKQAWLGWPNWSVLLRGSLATAPDAGYRAKTEIKTTSAPVTSGIKWRQITDDDLAAVAGLLSRGFQFRTKRYWLRGLRRQADRVLPANCPRYGYVLTHEGCVVGAVLMFSSAIDTPSGPAVRCNLSSWYVEPRFRNFASLLITAAMRRKDVTYLNISPAPHTWKTVEAQGFAPYCQGEMATLPALSAPCSGVTIAPVTSADSGLSESEARILADHQRLGCVSLVVTHDGRQYPFVFQKYRIAKRLLPCWRLVYCRDIADFTRFAGNLGRLLLRHGRLVVVVDANGPIAGLVGRYSDARGRKYARGPHVPRLGDLAFTEGVFFY